MESNLESNSSRYLSFSLGKARFAIPLLAVKEVVGDCSTTAIPAVPPYFKGVINLRGKVISILDLKTKLKLEDAVQSKERSIIIVEISSLLLGFLVDSVDQVCEWKGSDLSGPLDVPSAIETHFICGVAKSEASMTLILNLEQVLSVDDFLATKAMLQKAASRFPPELGRI